MLHATDNTLTCWRLDAVLPQRRLTRSPDLQDSEGAVIAQLMITYEWSDWRAKDIWWIQSVYVAPPHRKQGLFRSLYQHAKAESSKAGACGVRLYADNDNEKALKVVRSRLASVHARASESCRLEFLQRKRTRRRSTHVRARIS